MVDSNSDQDVPPRMLDLLRMAASSRGEQAVIVMESRKSKFTTKYRYSVRRSSLLEQFKRCPKEESEPCQSLKS
jgi:hypothetical protein